ncbi:hypothetical protein AOQ71_20915 [Bradyrhizobium manausense]|uniref:Uncharacterized protein n=1 Tax=Bradyrhizobium manausense TaxID=989370 RepID=A0A0R3DHF2_9BRAD|nr:hypothetical protein AOQ71_20915 [Bradyrhizobium manausense]
MARQRTNFSVLFERVTHFGIGHAPDEKFDKPVVHFIDDDEALGGDATLARIDQSSSGADGCREIEVGVLEHPIGIAAAELEHGLLQTARAIAVRISGAI